MPPNNRSSSHTATPPPTPLDPTRSRAAVTTAGTRRGARMQELRMVLGAGTTHLNPGPLNLAIGFAGNVRRKGR